MFGENTKRTMSDSFANEFEKWLERKTDKINRNDEEENTESDNDSEYAVNIAHNDESVRNKYQTHLSTASEQAPILVDDDDSDGGEKQPYEDEPPVLEPAPRQLQDYRMSDREMSGFSPQNCMRSYSRKNKMHSRTLSLQEHNKSLKTDSNKDNAEQLLETDNESSQNFPKSKDNKGSDNIFEKFSTNIYENFPLLLIPSPEVLQLHPQAPKLQHKYPSHSPDFCAMEADSTTEIIEDKITGLFSCQRLSKNSVNGDVAVECDSTCMLATSPMIVSPASVSNGDTEEVRDSGGGNIHGSNHCSVIEDESFCTKVQTEQQMPMRTEASNLITDLKSENAFKSEWCVLDRTEEPESHSCPHLTCKHDCQPFSLSVMTEKEVDGISDYPNEPPVLSAISPSLRSHHRSRKKRHTVDSPENISRSVKRLCTIPSSQTDVESDISPPTLTHVSETVATVSCGGKQSVLLQHSKDCLSCLQNKNHKHRKRQHRINTFPLADLAKHSSHVSEDLHKFITNTSQLSQLQTHMHMLLYELFPQLRSELDSMSPESARFVNLLSDLIISLEQPDIQMYMQDNSSAPPPFLCKDIKQNSISEIPSSDVLKLGYSFQSTTGKSSFPPHSEYQAANVAKNICHASVVCSPVSPSEASTSHGSTHRHHGHQMQESDLRDHCSDFVIPQLSRMTLKDVEELIRPSKVLLYRDPVVLLEGFVHLSCRALQLLLPDLTVSLYNELAGSPHDLVIFIDNVILTNSRQRSKH